MYRNLREYSNINWQNIFYFMSYCTADLKPLQKYSVNFEEIKGLYDLQATVLNIAFERVKRLGLMKDYTTDEIVTSQPRGKINITRTVNIGRLLRGQYVCNVSKTTEDLVVHQKIKLAFKILLEYREHLRSSTVSRINANLARLKEVSDITVKDRNIHSRNQIRPYYKPANTMAELIIEDKIMQDKSDSYRLYGPNEEESLNLLWEKFLRNYTREYILKNNSTYRVEKKSVKLTDVRNGIPDIIIYKDTEDSFLVILDAKWYTEPKIDNSIFFELHGYATKTGIAIKNKLTKSVAVFGYHSGYPLKKEDYTPTEREFSYELYGCAINVNQDFELIKQDINNMLDELLEFKETA